jgi:hypothetical protein
MSGSLLFPEKLPGASGPRLGDQQFTTGTEGTAIPLVYGAHVVPGNFIWAAPLDEVENTESQGGKGGPSQEVTTYTYFLSFAVGLCEGVITGVPRIWENGKLIYDRRSQQPGESATDYQKRLAASDELDEQITIYYGSEEQLPDPVIESHEGVGEVSAHRGLAYIVFERRDVTAFGGRPAQYQFEITRADLVYTPTSEITTDALPDWLEGTADPRLAGYTYQYRYGSTVYDTEAEAVAAAEADLGYSLAKLPIWRRRRHGEGPGEPSPLVAVDPGEDEFLNFQYVDALSFSYLNRALMYSEAEWTAAGGVASPEPFVGIAGLGIPLNTYFYLNIYSGLIGYLNSEGDPETQPAPTTGERGWVAGNNCLEPTCPLNPTGIGGNPGIAHLLLRATTDIGVSRVPAAPPLPGSDLPDWPVDPDDYWWDSSTGQIYSKQPWVQASGSYRWLSKYFASGGGLSTVQRKPLGPAVLIGSVQDTQAAWEAERDAAVAAGTLPSSVNTYDATGAASDLDQYPKNATYAYTRTYTAVSYADYAGTTVGSIVRDQCERSGLEADTDFDVSELTEIIHGYKVERVMNGRDIIAPLRQFSLFDGLETDKLRFPLRGGDIVATLTDDDLGAHEPGNSPVSLVEAQRIEDIELPYAVRVRYADTESEYQPGAQLATIKVTAGKSAVDVETTIAMTATEAAQMSEIMLQESVMRREDYTVRIGPHWLALTATDPIYIPLRGEYQRAMISEDTRALPGIIEAKAMRDDQSIYVSNATGAPGGAGEQGLTPIGDTDLVIIDGPALGSASNDAGVFIAACGASDRWRGFGLFESTDGGSNYSRIASYTLPSTMGTILDAIPEGPFDLWDYENSFTVAMDYGTLESRTQEEVVNGANAIFVGADGRWEVIQFADAVAEGIDSGGLTIYRLSTLLRGRQGTEHAIGKSQVGDRLALCITTQRLTMEVARIGIPRLFKAVSFGRTTESGPTQTFTPQGVALKPYAPTLPEGQRDGSENLDIYAVRRTRIAAEWGDSDYTPLNEEIEAYEVDIVADGSPDAVLRTLTGTSFPIEYTAAQQTADFGSPQLNIRVRIYQISTAVGRGYPCEAIL